MAYKQNSAYSFSNDLGIADTTTTPSNETKVTASDAASGDRFGNSVAVGNGRIVVGAPYNDDVPSNSGSAYIFDLDGNQLTKITASDAASGDNFGISVAVGNGKIVVGAEGDNSFTGAAYIFDLDGNQLTKITASDGAGNENFGNSVAVGSGKIVIGAVFNQVVGAAYIYDLDGTNEIKITASDGAGFDYFGTSVAVGNGKIVVGANAGDSAYIFDSNGNQLAIITASDPAGNNFGSSVAVGSGKIVVGSSGDNSFTGAAYIFDLAGNKLTKITANDAAGNENFGNSVAVGNGRIVVGAFQDDDPSNSGSAYIFDLNGTQLAKLTANDAAIGDWFGNSVAVGSGKIVVGANLNDDVPSSSGSAYIYDTPSQTHYLDILD